MEAECLPSLITCMRLLGGWSRSPPWEACAQGGQRVEHQQDLGPALKEQNPRSLCGFPLLPHGLGDAASSPGLLAPSGAVLSFSCCLGATCPGLACPREMGAGKAALAERAEAAV